MWKGLVHIREREFYLSTGELLYCSRPLYFITELINTSAKFESHYNILTVSCYLDHFFQFQHSSTRVEAVCPMLVRLLVHFNIVANCSKTWSVHCCLRYAFIIIISLTIKLVLVPIYTAALAIHRKLDYNHLIQFLWVCFIHLKMEITSVTLGSKR